MSMGPCDFMDEVLRLMKAHGIEYPQPEDEGDWSDEDYTSVTNALAKALRLGKAARDAAEREQYVVAFGSPADGFEYVGPFASGEDANEYGDMWLGDHDWWAILLQAPAPDPGLYRCDICGEASTENTPCCTSDDLPEPGDIRETGK
jgi:hypothetical protein